MVLRFTKGQPGAASDTLTCVRPDGTSTTLELGRQGVLPHEAIRYVVETTLGWSDGWLAELASRPEGKRARMQAQHSEIVAGCLQAEQWGGASAPDAFIAKVAVACAKRRLAPPTFTAEDVLRLRTKVREFGAAWRPLPPGGVLEFRV